MSDEKHGRSRGLPGVVQKLRQDLEERLKDGEQRLEAVEGDIEALRRAETSHYVELRGEIARLSKKFETVRDNNSRLARRLRRLVPDEPPDEPPDEGM